MSTRSLLPIAYPAPRSSKSGVGCLLPTRRVLWRIALLISFTTMGVALRPQAVFADPHAVFFTDTGQKQLFFNVLAALNQADYVEEPGKPPITHATEVGEAIKTGNIIDIRGQPVASVPPEPNERVELPRIRVRAVTSDNGDVYFRERMERQALAEQIRTELATISCEWQGIVLGDAVKAQCEQGQNPLVPR